MISYTILESSDKPVEMPSSEDIEDSDFFRSSIEVYIPSINLEVTTCSTEEYMNRLLDVIIEREQNIINSDIEDHGEEYYEKEYSGEKWYPTSLFVLGPKKYKERLRKIYCSPLPAFWENTFYRWMPRCLFVGEVNPINPIPQNL